MNRESKPDVWASSRPLRPLDVLLRTAKKIAKIALVVQACFVLIAISWIVFLTVLSFFIDPGDSPDPTPEEVIANLGIDMSRGTLGTRFDTHGGFLGDGLTFISVTFPDGDAENALTQNEKWSPLPLSRELSVLAYGDETQSTGPSIVDHNSGKALIPAIKNGYYCFIDRYKISDERPEDKNILERYSQNFTLVIYDTDTHTLYYAELDT